MKTIITIMFCSISLCSFSNTIITKKIDLAPSAKAYTGSIKSGHFRPGEFAITIDDGPVDGSTQDVLAALDEENVKATFFVVGYKLTSSTSKKLLIELAKKGHSIANHTYQHCYSNLIMQYKTTDSCSKYTGIEGIVSHLLGGTKIINETLASSGYSVSPLFRYPGGSSQTTIGSSKSTAAAHEKEANTAIADQGYAILDWNIETNDTGIPSGKRIVNHWNKFISEGKCSTNPYGEELCKFFQHLKTRGKTFTSWSSFDSTASSYMGFSQTEMIKKVVLARVLNSMIAEQGGIILMHDKYSWSGWLVREILKELKNPKKLMPLAAALAKNSNIATEDFKFTTISF